MNHILVVDDDEDTRKLLVCLLTDEGYTVTAVASATEALEAVTRRVLFDLIVLDVMLPEMDGLEVCRRIRAASPIPIIFLSALRDIKDKLAGFRAGGDDYIIKPFEPLEVLARVHAGIRRMSSRSPAGDHLHAQSDPPCGRQPGHTRPIWQSGSPDATRDAASPLSG